MAKLQKTGRPLSLKKDRNAIRHVRGTLRWDSANMLKIRDDIKKRIAGGERIDPRVIPNPRFDPDLTSALLGETGTIFQGDENNILYYNSMEKEIDGRQVKVTPNEELIHSGDAVINADTSGSIGSESIDFFFDRMSPHIHQIPIIATIDKAKERNHNWNIMNATFTLFNLETDEIIESYDFGSEWGDNSAVQIGSFVRNSEGEIEFEPIGVGTNNTLEPFFNMWGVETE